MEDKKQAQTQKLIEIYNNVSMHHQHFLKLVLSIYHQIIKESLSGYEIPVPVNTPVFGISDSYKAGVQDGKVAGIKLALDELTKQKAYLETFIGVMDDAK